MEPRSLHAADATAAAAAAQGISMWHLMRCRQRASARACIRLRTRVRMRARMGPLLHEQLHALTMAHVRMHTLTHTRKHAHALAHVGMAHPCCSADAGLSALANVTHSLPAPTWVEATVRVPHLPGVVEVRRAQACACACVCACVRACMHVCVCVHTCDCACATAGRCSTRTTLWGQPLLMWLWGSRGGPHLEERPRARPLLCTQRAGGLSSSPGL